MPQTQPICAFSKSKILRQLILPSCPLGLKSTKAAKCPCKSYVQVPNVSDSKASGCSFPNTWQGEPIAAPEALAAKINGGSKSKPTKRKKTKEPKETESMTKVDELVDTAKPNGLDLRTAADMRDDLNGAKPKTPTTAIATYAKFKDPLEAVAKLGIAFAESAMFGCHNKSQGQVLALACLTEGRSPIEIKRKYHLIGGNLSMRADAMLAEFRRLGGKHKIIERSPDRAAVELVHEGQLYEFEFTWEEAQGEDYTKTKSGDLKDNWSTPRRRMQMMWCRLISDSIRAVCPEVCAGQYTPEELSGDAYAEPQEDTIDAEFEVIDDSRDAVVDQVATSEPPAKPKAEEYAEPEPLVSTPVTREQLKEMSKLKKAQQIDTGTWQQLITKVSDGRTTTGKELSTDEAAKVLKALKKRAKQLDERSDTSKWADGALDAKAAGDQVGDEQLGN